LLADPAVRGVGAAIFWSEEWKEKMGETGTGSKL